MNKDVFCSAKRWCPRAVLGPKATVSLSPAATDNNSGATTADGALVLRRLEGEKKICIDLLLLEDHHYLHSV